MKKLTFIAVLIMIITIAAPKFLSAQHDDLLIPYSPPFSLGTPIELPDTVIGTIMFTIDSVQIPVLIEYMPNSVTIEIKYFACGPDGKVDITKEINAMNACFDHLTSLIIDYDGHKKAVAGLKQKIDFIINKPKPVEYQPWWNKKLDLTIGDLICSTILSCVILALLIMLYYKKFHR